MAPRCTTDVGELAAASTNPDTSLLKEIGDLGNSTQGVSRILDENIAELEQVQRTGAKENITRMK